MNVDEKFRLNGRVFRTSTTITTFTSTRPATPLPLALSRRILREGEPAVKDYLGFLSGGCSADPITLLRGAGVDMASPKPIEDATKLFDEMISEMEKILN